MHKYLVILLTSLTLTGCITAGDTVPVMAAGTWFNHDRRTTKAIIDDQAINVKANLAIAKHKRLWRESHVSTLSYNNALLLVGQARTRKDREEVEKIVQPIPGVCTIYNQITVGCPISLTTRTNDSWITTQVKARIASNRNVGINRVKVITENGVVYLMGALTEDEEQATINMARRVPGVQKVVTVFERPENVASNY